MEKQIEGLIRILKAAAERVYAELGPVWQEVIYQKAMEVALRHENIRYENQRILPITFADHVIGEAIPDLVIWVRSGKKRIAFVVDLKAEPGIKEEFQVQVERYIKELRKQMHHKNQEVYPKGLVINFVKEKTSKKLTEGYEDFDGVQVLEVAG